MAKNTEPHNFFLISKTTLYSKSIYQEIHNFYHKIFNLGPVRLQWKMFLFKIFHNDHLLQKDSFFFLLKVWTYLEIKI